MSLFIVGMILYVEKLYGIYIKITRINELNLQTFLQNSYKNSYKHSYKNYSTGCEMVFNI